MGKIVKYCSSCDEGFAERFGFCPTCGASLQAFAMNPLDDVTAVSEEPAAVETAPLAEPETMAADTFYDAAPEPEAESYSAPETVPAVEAGQIDQDDIEVSEPDEEEEVPVTIAVPAAANVHIFDAMHADEPRQTFRAAQYTRGDDDGYYVTVIEEKGVQRRNLLLLASTLFCVTFLIGATIYSLFDKDLGVGAIDDGKLFSAVIVDEPMTVEDEQIKKDKDEDDGGGGGGGKEEPDPVSRGDLPDQSKTPTRPPDPNVFRSDNFELKTPPPQTEGTRKFAKDYGKWGDPNSTNLGTSSGPGSGGGMGTGYGPGVGSGRGTGTGSGNGSGSGSGNGDGDGSGSGTGGGGPPPPASRPPITQDLRIISKKKPPYTDAARMNSVTGTVTLRVTFLASGQIGSIVTINGLPHGLTEQAIAAARQIRFEPKLVNGVAQSVSRPVTFSFTLY